MKTAQIIFLGLALFLVAQSTASHCSNCGLGSGTDPCGCSEVIIKPKQIRPAEFADPYVIKEAIAAKAVSRGCGHVQPPRKISGPSVTDLLRHSGPIAPRFQPVGDLCHTCKKTVTEVLPAYPGKPICNACAEKSRQFEYPSHHVEYTSFSAPIDPELNSFDDEGLTLAEQEEIYNAQPAHAVPVDPVSLALAYGLSQQSTKYVPEGSLIFGPKVTPIDGSSRKVINNIPEEKLLTVEKPVVELQLPQRHSTSRIYDEIIAQQEELERRKLELEAEAEDPRRGQSFISFSQLGYAPVKPAPTQFVNTVDPVVAYPDAEYYEEESACGPVGRPIPGYVSGNVIVRSESNQQQYDPESSGEGSYELNASYEQQGQDQYGSGSSEDAESSYDGHTGLLARLRASAQAQTGYEFSSKRKSCGCGSSY